MNTTINLIHLKFFCDAVIYESISEAARKNFISQSAVSQVITNRYPNIVIHPVEIPAFPYEICAIYNKGVKLSRTAELFLEHIKQE